MTRVSYAVEGSTDEPVAEKLVRAVGCEPWRRFTAGGKARLDPKLKGYNESARHQAWLVLRDLDQDAPCAPALVTALIGTPTRGMALRVPVCSTEAWLLADAEALSQAFRIRRSRLPADPDQLADPKGALVKACRSSASSTIRAAMLPKVGGGRKVGPEYGALVRAFAADRWRVDAAVEASPSLRRTVERLRVLVDGGVWADD